MAVMIVIITLNSITTICIAFSLVTQWKTRRMMRRAQEEFEAQLSSLRRQREAILKGKR